MASSENFATMDPWVDRLMAFPDSWISETYARDTEALTKALQISLCKNTGLSPLDAADSFNPVLLEAATTYSDVVTPSNLSGSDPDSPFPRRQAAAGVTGKVTKRKSRASKRCQITYISADPANFRQMVQEVTGVKFNRTMTGATAAPHRTEPQKDGPSAFLQRSVNCLPTLDTSALFLDRYHQNVVPTAAAAIPEPFLVGTETRNSFNFETYSCFPTLESFHS